MVSLDAVTVLTTPEHVDAFVAVFGESADYRFDCRQTAPLRDYLGNLTLGGGSIAVLDEAHFISPSMMLRELRAYANDPRWRGKQLRLIVVCLKRAAGDALLAELVACCGIYDIVYGVGWTEAVIELGHLLKRPNDRFDVLELVGSIHSLCGEGASDDHVSASLEPKAESEILLNEKLRAQGSIKISIVVSQEDGA